METLAYLILSLIPSILLGVVALRLTRLASQVAESSPPPVPPTPPEPTVPNRLQNEAALLSLAPQQRCALLLTSLDESTGWAVYKMLDPLHGEMVVTEIPRLPALHPSARQQMFETVAEQMGVPLAQLHQRLRTQPELAAELIANVLPMTPWQVMEELEPSHALPEQWGSQRGDAGKRRLPFSLSALWDILGAKPADDDWYE